jgi:hypothetical protein
MIDRTCIFSDNYFDVLTPNETVEKLLHLNRSCHLPKLLVTALLIAFSFI